jgi:hypothetical protein
MATETLQKLAFGAQLQTQLEFSCGSVEGKGSNFGLSSVSAKWQKVDYLRNDRNGSNFLWLVSGHFSRTCGNETCLSQVCPKILTQVHKRASPDIGVAQVERCESAVMTPKLNSSQNNVIKLPRRDRQKTKKMCATRGARRRVRDASRVRSRTLY